jgi:hypothetical protein
MKVLIVSVLLFCSVELGSGVPVHGEVRGVSSFDFTTISYSESYKNRTKELPPNKLHNDLSLLHPAFRNGVILFLADAKKEGIDLMIVETYRSPQRQSYVKSRGRSTLSVSKHQSGLAIDVVPIVNGSPVWHNKKLWYKIMILAEKRGLKSGGRWKRFYDPGHIEYPCNLSQVDTVKIPNLTLIPL